MAMPINTVFILGAGASKQAGVPLMGEFIDVARDLRRIDDVGDHASDFDIVFEAITKLQLVHSKSQFDLQNIETVFSAFEFARILRSFCGYDFEHISRLSSAAKGLIAHTVERTLVFPRGDRGPASPEPYGQFAELLYSLRRATPAHNIVLMTFNYDFALDFALRGISSLSYGMTGQRADANEVTLLKLHGSINWAVCRKCGSIVPISFEDFEDSQSRADYSRLDRFQFGGCLSVLSHCHMRVDPQPFLVPPTWNKTSYHEKLSAIWSLASMSLANADNIVVIGYSLPETDMFFRQLYALGSIGEHLLERFWVFDPDKSGRVRSRFEALLGPGAAQRFRFVEETFEQSIGTLFKEFRVK